jgi:leader peptidase (prepilin peptidase) / N-methyltransferase
VDIILAILVGLAVGSFLNVVADRVPCGESLLRPASRCPSCGRHLTPLELVPIVSYLALGGRCRSCGAEIPRRVLIVEAVTAALFGWLAARYGPSLDLVIMAWWTSLLIVLFVIDLEHRIVPNVIILPAIAIGLLMLPLHLVQTPSFGLVGWWQASLAPSTIQKVNPAVLAMVSRAAGAVIAFGVFLLIHLLAALVYRSRGLEGMGAGDVRLSFLCGLLTGYPLAMLAVAGSFVLGGLISAGLLMTRVKKRTDYIPFAPFMILSTYFVMIFSDHVLMWYLR